MFDLKGCDVGWCVKGRRLRYNAGFFRKQKEEEAKRAEF